MKKYNYVYIIINKVEKKYYIGVRSCNIKPKDDLGRKYFSSSTDKDFIKEQKENPKKFKYKIISEFETRKKAIEKEIELHEKYNVNLDTRFYNKAKQTSNGFDISGNKEIALKISESNKGKKPWNEGKELSKEAKEKLSIANKGKIWVNNKINSKQIWPSELNEYLENGYEKGSLIKFSEESRNLLSIKRTGTKLSDEHKKKISESGKGIKKSENMKEKLSSTRSNMIYINDKFKEKVILKEKLDEFLNLGWIKGKLPMSDYQKSQISKARKKNETKT